MSRKICRHCNSSKIRLVKNQDDKTHRIYCAECECGTHYHDSIAAAWHEWTMQHQKELSKVCACGERVLTRWKQCPVCGDPII